MDPNTEPIQGLTADDAGMVIYLKLAVDGIKLRVQNYAVEKQSIGRSKDEFTLVVDNQRKALLPFDIENVKKQRQERAKRPKLEQG